MAVAATPLPVKREEQIVRRSGSAWTPFDRLRREVDRLFDDLDGDLWRIPTRRWALDLEPFWRRTAAGIVPATDITETDAAYEVVSELPGIDEKDIAIAVSNGVLTIDAEKKAETEQKRKDYYVSERCYGTFRRSFAVPEDVNAEKIEASFAKGVLKVTLPKSPDSQKKQKHIPIKTG